MHVRTSAVIVASFAFAFSANAALAQVIPQPPSNPPSSLSTIPQAPAGVPLTVNTLTVNGTEIPNFFIGRTAYTYEIAASDASTIPVIAATTIAPDATITLAQTTVLPGDAIAMVSRGTESVTYTVHFTVTGTTNPQPTEPQPTHSGGHGGGGGGGSSKKSSSKDVTAPSNISIAINKNATKTDSRKVTLTLRASDATGPIKMQVTEDPQFRNEKWVSYSTSKTFTLAGDAGTKTVYVRFMDGKKNVSGFAADSIMLTEKGAKMPYTGVKDPAGIVLGTSNYVFTTWLEMGSTGNDVVELQKRLTLEKVYTGPITGYYGIMTTLGVINYQKQHGLPVTGKVDLYTRTSLNK